MPQTVESLVSKSEDLSLIIFPFPTPSRSFPPSYPYNFSLSLLPSFSPYLSRTLKMKTWKLKQTIKQKEKQTKSPLNNGVCFAQLLLTMKIALKCGWYAQWQSVEEKWFSLSQQVIISNTFLFVGRILYLPPPPSARILSGLNLCRFCAYCHSLYEFVCVSIQFCLEDSILLGSSFGFYNLAISSSSI